MGARTRSGSDCDGDDEMQEQNSNYDVTNDEYL